MRCGTAQLPAEPSADPPAEPYHLFRAHFLLFNALYELRDRCLASRQAVLRIHALDIRWLPWEEGEAGLDSPDPLRDYYLDWSNLDDTSAVDVEEMIDSFWSRIGRIDGRAEALAELGLEDPVDDDMIKKRWRRLAMEHHPDRGGDTEQLQTIHAAIRTLLP